MARQKIPQEVVTYASKLIHEYEFSWTVENFSRTPNILRGPSVPSIPGFPEELCIELQFKQYHDIVYSYYSATLKMSLMDLNDKDRNLTVSSCTSIRNTNDTTIKEDITPSTEFKDRFQLLEYSYSSRTSVSKQQLSQKMNLVEDKVVVKGKLSFSGHDITTSVSSLMDKNGNESCGELSNDFKTTYENGSASDITFSVGEQTLCAHKFVLCSRSPVFARMFDSDISESNTKKVIIQEAEFHGFNHFLKFLYTGIVEDKEWDTVLSLYSLAHKYQVKSLHVICSEMLRNSLTIDSVCSCLLFSDLHGDKDLKNVAKVFIRHHIIQIAGTPQWIELATTKSQLVKEVLA